MALSFYIEVSPGSPGAPPSVEDAAFVPLAGPIADSGSGFSFAHVASSTPAVVPGVLYAYRARRYDDQTGLYSAWSPVALARAPLPYQENTMEYTVDAVITGGKSQLGIGIEPLEGVAVKATKLFDYRSGGMKRTITTLFGQPLRNAPTRRTKRVAGMTMWEGQFVIECTPEGAFALMVTGLFPVTVAGGSAPYTATFKNAYGDQTFTLIQREGNFYKVYPGCRVQSMQVNNLLAEPGDIVTVTVNVLALNEVVYDAGATPSFVTALGMDTAGTDTLPPYSGVHISSTIGAYTGSVRSVNLSITRNLGKKKTMDGTRGYKAHYATKTDISLSAEVFFEDLTNILRDYGLSTTATTPAGVTQTAVLAPVSIAITPPVNGSGYSNTWTFSANNAVIAADEEVKDEKEIPQTLTISTVDAAGDASGTDFFMTLVNALPLSSYTTASTPIANFPRTEAHRYFDFAVKTATPSPTTTSFTADSGNIPSFSTVVNDPTIVGKTLWFLTGALAGTGQTILTYAVPAGGNGGAFTFNAFGSAPTGGDIAMIR